MVSKCYGITQATRDTKQRCTEDVNHKGPHWSKTEPLPPGCKCKYFCACGEKAKR